MYIYMYVCMYMYMGSLYVHICMYMGSYMYVHMGQELECLCFNKFQALFLSAFKHL